MASVLAIVNPAAGGGRCKALAPQALDRVRAAGLEVEVATTGAAGDATRIAREAYASGTRGFLAVGGDGTSYEIVNGLLPAAAAPGAERPWVGFLPLGTGNSFLRDFGTGDAEQALSALAQGRKRACDVVRLTHDDGALHYINLLSLGFVADVATTANRRFKALGPVGYVCGVVVETASLHPRTVEMRIDDEDPWLQPLVFASFCNSKFTGGRMMMAPYADTADGRMDVIIARGMGRFALLTAFPRIFTGNHVHLPSIACSQARRVSFEVDAPIDLMIDGEVERHRPRALEVLQGAIDVCV
jgi:diacylglycerol kinase (ATP)